jgi:hypothetical protein
MDLDYRVLWLGRMMGAGRPDTFTAWLRLRFVFYREGPGFGLRASAYHSDTDYKAVGGGAPVSLALYKSAVPDPQLGDLVALCPASSTGSSTCTADISGVQWVFVQVTCATSSVGDATIAVDAGLVPMPQPPMTSPSATKAPRPSPSATKAPKTSPSPSLAPRPSPSPSPAATGLVVPGDKFKAPLALLAGPFSNVGATVAPGEPIILPGHTFSTLWLSSANSLVQAPGEDRYSVRLHVRVVADFQAVVALYSSEVEAPSGPSALTRLGVGSPCADPTTIGEMCVSGTVTHAKWLWVTVGGYTADDQGTFDLDATAVM